VTDRCTVEVHENRADWLAARKLSIGASDAPEILGKGYGSPFSWWAIRTGRSPGLQDSRRFRFGHFAEPFIASEMASEANLDLVDPGAFTIFRSATHPWQHATPDRLALSEAAGGIAPASVDHFPEAMYVGLIDASAQFKTVASQVAAEKWGDLPAEYAYIQVQHELMTLGLSVGWIAALVGSGEDFRLYRVEQDPDMWAELARSQQQMLEWVETDTMPPADGHEETTRTIKELWHDSAPGKVVRLGGDMLSTGTKLEAVKAQIAELEAEESRLSNKIKLAAGDAERIEIEGLEWAYQWKSQVRINPPRLEEQRIEMRPFRRVKA